MKTESPVKKHHFWILFGVVPLFTLIAVLVVSGSVGGKIADREKEIKGAVEAIAAKQNPKPKSLIEYAGVMYERVSSKQGDLHKINWERQKDLYKWPEGSALLRQFNSANYKFGDKLPTTDGQFEEFKNRPAAYIHEYSSLKKDGSGIGTGMADKVAPTQFRGGWQSVLRYVSDFGGAQITNDQVWLMMEDIWVQRSLLDAVRSINADVSAFRRAKADKDGNVTVDPSYDEWGYKIEGGKRVATPEGEKRKATFRNRVWSVDLELVPEGATNKQRLVGTLTNQSERLQLMGVGNVMTLRVWFSKNAADAPLTFKIGGEFLPGKGATKRDKDGRDVPANVLPIVPIDDHIIPEGMAAGEIVRVEQVFDIRTVPVKRIEALALGFLDSRNAGKPLVGPGAPFAQEAPADPSAAPTTGAPTGGRPGGPTSSLGPDAGGPTMPGPATGGTGTNASKPQQWGGGPLVAVIDGNKKRYLEVTPQVRRMPVGIVVVVDQAYMQDMLLAFANSPLRFQITQVAWTRFRGSLAGISGGSSGPGGGPEIVGGAGGTINFGGSGDPDAGGPRPGMSAFGGGPRPGIALPGGPMAAASGGSLGPTPTGPSGPTGPPGGFGGPMGGGFSGGGFSGLSSGLPATVSESQITSSLVELSIYGIVSLYEKYEAPKPPDAPKDKEPDPKAPDAKAPDAKYTKDVKDATPKDTKEPMGKEPAPKEPMGKDPMPAPAPKEPGKMRRRVRV